MDRPVSREIANAGVVVTLFAVGFACAGPIGGVVTNVGGQMLAGLTERGWAHLLDRFLGDHGIQEPDLQAAMRRAYIRAMNNLERRWREIAGMDLRPNQTDDNEAVRGLFAMLREDAQLALTQENLRTLARDPAALRELGSGQAGVRAALDRYLTPYLHGHEEGLAALVRKGLEPELAACFAEELKVNDQAHNRAWRTYQRLVLEGLQTAVAAVQSKQFSVSANLKEMAEVLARIDAWAARLDHQVAEEREHTGEKALEILVLTRDEVLAAITDEAEATRGVVVQESEETRAAIRSVRDELLQNLAQESRRAQQTPNADVLLRGPIKALSLQDQLNRADTLNDRVAAAVLYDQIALRLYEAGYGFHASLVRQRRAEAFAIGGAIEAAYTAWLDDAASELEGGSLWIPSHAKRGLDAHRDAVGPLLAARAVALEGLEAWYEQPVVAIRAMRRVLDILRREGDSWAPRVGIWLGEAVAVDVQLEGITLDAVCGDLASLATSAEEASAVRLRTLIAEATGNWDDLRRDASTGALAPADAGLVLCRHGRWLALNAEPDAAIDEYRRAVEKLAQANLLGDAAGALRAIAQIKLRYSDDPSAANEDFNLARLVAHLPTRIDRRSDKRGAGLEALYETQSGRDARLPDALRNLRRYLWEARISGHLRTEFDAQALLGDVFRLGGEPAVAIYHYILAGQDKQVADLTKHLSLVPVEEYLYYRAPWVIGSALAAIATQGEKIPAESVEHIAPRIIELTAGVRQSMFRPEVQVEAWAALAAIALQLPGTLIDPVLDCLEPLIEREPNHYRRMDDSMVELLVRFHRFRPEAHHRVAAAVARCLSDSLLAQSLTPYLCRAAANDDVLKQAVLELADTGSPIGVRILAAAGIQHRAVAREAASRAESVLSHEVGKVRTELSVSNRFEQAAAFASYLPQAKRDELASHLLAIAQDALSPEAYRSSAANALAILADNIDDAVKLMALEGMLALIGAGPSEHPIDVFSRNSLHPFSRFRNDTRGLSLPRAAMVAAGRLASTPQQAKYLVETLLSALNASLNEQDLSAALGAIQALDPAIRPPVDLQEWASHPLPIVRSTAVSLWADNPATFPDLGFRLARDLDEAVRQRLAGALTRVAERDSELTEQLRAVLSQDPSAAVRAVALSG